jgi:DNA-binding response OmpR family regulator
MAPKRMLIVEDREGTRRALRGIFRPEGYELLTAATLAVGLALLDPPPCWIILDLMLSDGPGEDLLRTLRATGHPSRVVVCTGNSDPARLDAVRRLRPDASLQKPVDVGDLTGACEESPN